MSFFNVQFKKTFINYNFIISKFPCISSSLEFSKFSSSESIIWMTSSSNCFQDFVAVKKSWKSQMSIFKKLGDKFSYSKITYKDMKCLIIWENQKISFY